MRRSRIALALVIAACNREPSRPVSPPSPVLDSPDVPAPQAFRDASVEPVTRDASTDAPPISVTTPAVPDPNATSVDRLVALSDGAVLVRAMNREGRRASEIIATRLDAEGMPTGAPRLLRRTTGPVTELDASAAGGRLWIAWGSARPADEARADHLIAALRASPDLATVERPITLHDFRAVVGDESEMAPQALPRIALGVIAREDGGATVVSSAPVTTCLHGEDDHVSRTPCRGWSVARIAADGSVTRRSDGAIAHLAGPSSLTAVPGGFAFAVSSAHIGFKTQVHVHPAEVGANPPFRGDVGWHYAHLRLARAGDSLLAWGQPTEGNDAQGALGNVRVFGAAASTTRLRRDAAGVVAWPALRSRALRCVGGRPVIALQWSGGSATLEGPELRWSDWVQRRELPGLEGDGATPQLAFTGRVLVAWDANGWNRYRCGARGSIAPAQ